MLGYIEANINESKGKFKLISKATAIGAKEEEDIENMIRKLNEKQDENNSRNDEEDNEEGMAMHLEGVDDEIEENSKKQEPEEEEKKAIDNSDEEDDN